MLGGRIREVPSITPPPLTPPPPSPKEKKNRNPNLQKCNFENIGQMKFKQCKATKDAQNTLVTINNSTPGFKPSVPSLMIKFRQKKYQSCWFTILWQSYGVIFSSMGGENSVNLKTGKNFLCAESWYTWNKRTYQGWYLHYLCPVCSSLYRYIPHHLGLLKCSACFDHTHFLEHYMESKLL